MLCIFWIGFCGLFVKFVLMFIVVGFVVMVLLLVLMSVLWCMYVESDICCFFGNFDCFVLVVVIGAVDLCDLVVCCVVVDVMFW